jgi:tetratricopeptide (TPR) repeat protein
MMTNKLKAQISPSKSEGKTKTQNLKPLFISLLFLIVSAFLFLNILASQEISSLYFQIVNNEKPAVVAFLKKIRRLPEFSFFFKTNKNIYGPLLEKQVFEDERKKEEKLVKLESLLQKNPKSRDVLYELYLTNKDLGNGKKAEKYLKMAKEIDPDIE